MRNLLLFAPFGLLMGLAGRRPGAAVLAGALLSIAIEPAHLWIPDRFPGVRDVVANTLGVAIGAAFARALIGPTFQSSIRSARWAFALGMLGACVLLLPGALLQPAPPRSVYYPAWTPMHPRYAAFPGSVLEARIGDLRIEPSGPSDRSLALRERLVDGSAITIEAVLEQRPVGIAPLVRINDGSWEVLLVGIQGDDLVVRRHSHAGELGFEEPTFRGVGALELVSPGQPFRIELVPRGVSWLTHVEASPLEFGPTPGTFWRLVADSDSFPETLRRALDALAVALAFGSMAIWFRPRGLAILGVTLMLAALVLATHANGMTACSPGEWMGVAIGLVGGAFVQGFVRRRTTVRAD